MLWSELVALVWVGYVQLSFDIEDKESDLALTANLVMVNASDPESVTCDLLGFLYDSNCRLSVCADHEVIFSQSQAIGS